jgi:LemA protein
MVKVLVLLLVSLVVGLLVVGGCVWSGYNKAVTLDEQVASFWAQVENQLQRRFDLIPNLVETVKGVAAHEEEVFLGIAEARKAYFQAQESGGIAAKAKAAVGLNTALSRLLMLKETYPQLKANESFLKLQDSIEGTENRLSVERKRYNDAVRTLNTFTRRLGGGFFASLAGVEKAEYFEVEEQAKEVPKVSFSDDSKSE